VAVAAEVSKEVAFLVVQAAVQVETLMHLHSQAEQELQVKELMAV
jgi:heme/copper-type cytochrome/quinol oxidase subunit 4